MRCCSKTGKCHQRPDRKRGGAAHSKGSAKFIRPAVIVLLLLLLLAQTARSAGPGAVPVFHSSLRAASEAAASDQSLVLLIFGADWCVPCRQLKAQTLASKEFMEQAGALHIVEVDVDAEATMARDYDVQAVPTLVFLTADNKIVARSEGFAATAELLLRLKEAREHVKSGKWEGTAPASKVSTFIAKAAADQLETNDLARLIELLGETSPADRDAAARILIEQREQAMPFLIEATTNSYLGVRIAASEALHKLAPEVASLDPWQAPGELGEALATLKNWWATTGKLPARQMEPSFAPGAMTSILAALDGLRGNDPAQRTDAMARLVALGMPALPAVREAIKNSEKTEDQRSLALLEDVRWAILVPDTVDERAGGVRSVLARGKSSERQGAVSRMSRAGRAAIPALAELVEDSDSLVVENAARSLSSIGGKDAIPAMAALLKASDSNLRMTAAQALGQMKNADAVKELLTVLDDPNEVVACAALSALEEMNGEREYSPAKQIQPPEVVQGLKRCLSEPRWRVRAAAAEVVGKLGVKELINELNMLLSDPDGFVVKSALDALEKLGAAPTPEKLLALANRLSGLRGEAVDLLVKGGNEESVKIVTELYESDDSEGRLVIVRSLGNGSERGQQESPWLPLLSKAASDSDPRLRRAAAEALAAEPAKSAASLVGKLLSDEDEETRVASASLVLSILGGERASVYASHGTRIVTYFSTDEVEDYSAAGRRKASATNTPAATAEQISAWHAALEQKASGSSNLVIAAARYVTGSSNADLSQFQTAIEGAGNPDLQRLAKSAALAAVVPRLPWPDSKSIIERLSANPALFLKMTAYAQKASPGLTEFLFEPQRFKAAVEPASHEELETSLQQLLGQGQKGWTLLSTTPGTDAIVKSLLNATNAVWRAAALYCVGLRDDPKAQEYMENGLTDTNGWVRAAAVSGLERTVKERAALERVLAPMLTDTNQEVARLAALGLLERETRTSAGLEYAMGNFQFEKISVWSSPYQIGGQQRPLATLPGNPPFLKTASEKLTNGLPEISVAALLLAQYGDFTGLEQLVKTSDGKGQQEHGQDQVLLTAIELSRDAKYLPYLKNMVGSAKDEQELRRLLQALRGMSGSDARELRLEINKRMRQGRE
jgi:HEAT repeat protein